MGQSSALFYRHVGEHSAVLHGYQTQESTKKQKGLEDRKDMEAQINAMTSEIAHLMDRLAITQQRKKEERGGSTICALSKTGG